MLLSEEELFAALDADVESIADVKACPEEWEVIKTMADAIEAAILARLAAKELPEPAGKVMAERRGFVSGRMYRIEDRIDGNPLFTADQLTAWGNTRYAQGFAAGAAAQLAEKPSGYLSQYNLEMLQQGYPQTIVMIEGAKRDVPLYTRREA